MKLNATDVKSRLATILEMRVTLDKVEAEGKRSCTHTWADGTSSLGRPGKGGICERCSVCGQWIET